MKTAAIIAEYNPFHHGHQYLIEETRRAHNADYCIVVMSGNFVQRGFPAITDKYSRTAMALAGGADLVLELPVFYAAGSAEYFAGGAVALLDRLGVVDLLSFGSECGNVHTLKEAALLLTAETHDYKAALLGSLKQGCSYPAARKQALQVKADTPSSVLSALHSPNNILGIEYCKALLRQKSTIRPVTVTRNGAGYHDPSLNPTVFASATAIRKALEDSGSPDAIAEYIPTHALPPLAAALKNKPGMTADDFSGLLYYKLLLDAPGGYRQYLDVTDDLSDKILKNLNGFSSYMSFCRLLKSKDLTLTRISRCMLHILLNITKEEAAACQTRGSIFYARILGLKKESSGLLHTIKANTSIPLIAKLADAPSHLTGTGLMMLQKDIQAAHIYDGVYAGRHQIAVQNEYTRKLVISTKGQ